MSHTRRSFAAALGNLATAGILCLGLLVADQTYAAQVVTQQAVTAPQGTEAAATTNGDQQDFAKRHDPASDARRGRKCPA